MNVYTPGSEEPLSEPEDGKIFERKSGKISILVYAHTAVYFWVILDFTLKLKKSAVEEWRLKTWNTIRDAAYSKYQANRQTLENKLAQLKEELGVTDPLSLRKIEREEVMKGVMRWMLGPSFKFSPSNIPKELYEEDSKAIRDEDNIWKNVTLHGDVIKFLHQAIEWENMLYFLYPYFWSHTTRWEEKKYMQHPDIMHRTFLKAGAARVVLTIRPGFEENFTYFVEHAGLRLLPNQPTSYVPITKEMENYAKTNYPGVPTVNPSSEARPLLLPQQRKAWKEMQDIARLLDAYFEDEKNKKSYPPTEDKYESFSDVPSEPSKKIVGGLKALKPYLKKSIHPKVKFL